jgi:ubiquinone/menaquinone biosynthesis C-methylase UbiE
VAGGMTKSAITRRLRGFCKLKVSNVFSRPDGWIGKQVLDVGTGRGFSAIFLARLVSGRVYTVERAKSEIRKAREQRMIKIVKGCAEDLPCPSDYFDVVVTYGSLHDFEGIRRAFKEFNRVLKEGGMYAAVEPTPELAELFKEPAAGFPTPEKVRELLLDSNFFVVDLAKSEDNLSFFIKAKKKKA